jgi:hypothetical protein
MGNSLACESFKKLQSAYEVSGLGVYASAFLYIRLVPSLVVLRFLDHFSTIDKGNRCSHTFMQVLSDLTKKNSYDEQLRKEESRQMTQRSRAVSQPVGSSSCK